MKTKRAQDENRNQGAAESTKANDSTPAPSKKVILFLVDALTARLLQPAIEEKGYSNLQQLCENGRWQESISIFPSITHAALSSLVTGAYPKDHGVLGSCWYSTAADTVTYLGADPQVIWNEGIDNFYEDFLINLNHNCLQQETIFQQLERAGFHTTCLNHLIFRGDKEHCVNAPLVLRLLSGMAGHDQMTVMGPEALFLGDFVQDTAVSNADTSLWNTGPQNWFGFKDSSAHELLLRLADANALGDFTLVYFPENDFISHENGPEVAHQQLQTFDEMLGELFSIYGGLEAMLADFALIITGDHSQSAVHQDAPAINMEQILAPFQCSVAGLPWQAGDEIMVCANLRAATLYFRNPQQISLPEVVTRLRTAPGIDLIVCPANRLNAEQDGYLVLSQRGELRFWRGGDATDAYGNQWQWEGELAAVDGRFQDNGLRFGDYPNAFERLAGVLDSKDSGPIWLSAVPGHEFFLPKLRIHAGGGSHGSLHRLDSISPLITAGLPQAVTLPEQPRLVDVAPLCRAILNTPKA